MADSIETVAVGGGGNFELTFKNAAGAMQKFELPIAAIPELVQQLAAVAWASAASNRPSAGTVLPKVHALPVRKCEIGSMQDSKDPVMMVELFGGIALGLHFSPETARTAAAEFAHQAAASSTSKH